MTRCFFAGEFCGQGQREILDRELERDFVAWKIEQASRRGIIRGRKRPAEIEPPDWVAEASKANPGVLFRGPWTWGDATRVTQR